MPFSWAYRAPLVKPTRIGWSHWLVPQTVSVEGADLFYVVKGEGEPVILIHGYGAGMWIWEKQIDFLSRFYKVYALDLIGHGFSDRPRIPYTPERYVRSFRHFMDGIGIESAILVGNSMGGGLAWAMAGLFPERVSRLVLIDSMPPDVFRWVRNDSFRTLAAVRGMPLLLYLILSTRSRKSIRWILEECISDRDLITEAVVERQYRLSMIRGTTWVLYSTFRNGGDAETLRAWLSRVRQPTLLIWGEDDLIFPLSVGDELQASLRGSHLTTVPKSGHIPMWETPETVNQSILTFLKE
jgi:pimeloyl-ACP methyl ester carboxylesterase